MTQLGAQSSLRVLGISAIILLLGASAAPKDPLVADAAMRGDVATVRRLISQHADVNTPQGDGMTALHWAAERGDTALSTALIKAHANVKALTRIGNYTPLLIAARSGNPAVISALIKAGSDVNAATSNGTSVLHFAAAAGDPKAIEELIARGANVNARDSAWGRTPLIFAAEKDRAAAITVLMKHGADATVRSKYEGVQEETARDQAATKKRNEVLIAYEPEKHKTDSADAAKAAAQAAADAAAGGFGGFGGGRRGNAGPQPKGPFTPDQMQHAIEEGRKVLLAPSAAKGPVTEEVDTLNGGIAGFGNSVGGVGGLSALHHAARNGNIAAAMALLDGGAPIDERNMADSTTPLLLAIINGQFDVAMKLVERGADVNTESAIAMTPLYAAINTQWAPKSRYPQPQAVQNQRTGYLELMEALLKKGANPNVRLTAQPWYFAFNNCGNANCGLENIEGTTSFWRAAYAVDVDAMKLLVDHGADPNLPSQRMQTQVAAGRGRGGRGGRGGGGAGGAAGDSTRAGAASAFAQRGGGGGRGGPQLPLDPRVDSAAKVAPVGLGVYAIHAAAGVGYGNGFAGNSHRHAPDGWMPAMKYLVEVLHADVNARDQQGMTPLHHAAARGDNEMILYLVAHGADPKAVSRTGRTTVDMANGPVQRLRPFPETIALLEKLGAINQHHCVSC